MEGLGTKKSVVEVLVLVKESGGKIVCEMCRRVTSYPEIDAQECGSLWASCLIRAIAVENAIFREARE